MKNKHKNKNRNTQNRNNENYSNGSVQETGSYEAAEGYEAAESYDGIENYEEAGSYEESGYGESGYGNSNYEESEGLDGVEDNYNSEEAYDGDHEDTSENVEKSAKKNKKEKTKKKDNQKKESQKKNDQKSSKRNSGKGMNKKQKFMIIGIIVAILLVIGIIALIVAGINKGKVRLFTDTDYPCWYKQKKENIVLSIDGRVTSDNNWNVEVGSDSVELLSRGKESGGKVKYTLTPKAAGLCDIRFYKMKEVAGYEYEMVSVYIPAYVEEVEEGLVVRILEDPELVDNGGADGGRNTDYPYLLMDQNDGTGKILFINGQNDWRVTSDNDMVFIENIVGAASSDGSNGKDSIIINNNASYDPESTTEANPYNTEEAGGSHAGEKKGEQQGGADEDSTTQEKNYTLAKDPEKLVITKDDIDPDGHVNIDLSDYMVEGETELRPEVDAIIEKKILEALGDDAVTGNDNEETDEETETSDSEDNEDGDLDNTDVTAANGQKKETVLTISSESLGVTEYIKVVVRQDGKVMLYTSKKR